MRLNNGQFGRKYILDESSFDYITTEQAAYWLGFLYADGTIYKHTLKVVLKSQDANHLKKLADFLKCNRDIKISERRIGNKQYSVSYFDANSEHLVTSLISKGIEKGRQKFSLCLRSVPRHLFSHFARGLFDGDGSANTHPSLSFLGSFDLVYFIRALLSRNSDTNPNLKLIQHQKSKSVWYVIYSGRPQCLRIAAYLYRDATIWLPRKRQRIESWPERKPVSRDAITGRWLPSG